MYQRVFTAKPVAGAHVASRRSSITVRAATALPAEVSISINTNSTFQYAHELLTRVVFTLPLISISSHTSSMFI
jgi:hypothetical protein